MQELGSHWTVLWLLSLTALAARSDARSGVIPNRLTLTALGLAPLLHAAYSGPGAGAAALGAAVLCGLPPLVLFAMRGIGGGDVKLFAAIGAAAGARLGLELQGLSYVLAIVHAMAALARDGRLGRACAQAMRLAAAPFVPGVSAPSREHMSHVRLGIPVFLACVAVLAQRWLEAWQ